MSERFGPYRLVSRIDLAHDDAALRARINDVLEAAATDGTWARLYAATLGPAGSPPVQR